MSPDQSSASRLEELLALAAEAPVSRDEFEQTVLAASLHALMPARDGTNESSGSPEVELVTWSGETGAVVPIFTSEARVREATEGRSESYEVVEVPGAALFQVLAQTGLPVALNPNCPYGKLFTVAEIVRLGGTSQQDPGATVE
jgi:hypothetical protein